MAFQKRNNDDSEKLSPLSVKNFQDKVAKLFAVAPKECKAILPASMVYPGQKEPKFNYHAIASSLTFVFSEGKYGSHWTWIDVPAVKKMIADKELPVNERIEALSGLLSQRDNDKLYEIEEWIHLQLKADTEFLPFDSVKKLIKTDNGKSLFAIKPASKPVANVENTESVLAKLAAKLGVNPAELAAMLVEEKELVTTSPAGTAKPANKRQNKK